MSGMIQTVGSQFSGINYQGISKFCVKWASRAVDFCQTIPNRVGPENLKVGGAFVLTNVFCYLVTSRVIANLEKRFETHDKVSGRLTDRQISLKQGVFNGVIPITLVVIFNVALGKVIKHELSLIALLGITATAVIIRHLLNRPNPPAGPNPPADPQPNPNPPADPQPNPNPPADPQPNPNPPADPQPNPNPPADPQPNPNPPADPQPNPNPPVDPQPNPNPPVDPQPNLNPPADPQPTPDAETPVDPQPTPDAETPVDPQPNPNPPVDNPPAEG